MTRRCLALILSLCVLFMLAGISHSDDRPRITVIKTFDESGKVKLAILRNVDGEDIAMAEYKGNNFVISEPSGKTLLVIKYDQEGKAKNEPLFFCLDDKGNIVKDNSGNPVLLKPFPARQKAEISKTWKRDEKGVAEETLIKTEKYFPCSNCEEVTGMKCTYVW